MKGEGAPTFGLHYLRIQNHLRKMGLARETLEGIADAGEGDTIAVVPPDSTKRRPTGACRTRAFLYADAVTGTALVP